MADSAMPAVYTCLQLSNAPGGVTESPEKTTIHLSWMDPKDLAVTLSPEYINNTYRDKCAPVHRIKCRPTDEASGILHRMIKGLVEIHFLLISFQISTLPVKHCTLSLKH